MTQASAVPAPRVRPDVVGYAAIVAGLAISAVSMYGSWAPVTRDWLMSFAIFSVTAVSVRPLPRRRAGGISFSAFSIFQLVAIPFMGPLGAALAGPVQVLLDRRLWRVRIHLLLNVAVTAATGALSAVAYVLVGGANLTTRKIVSPVDFAWQVMVPVLLAGAVLHVLNFVLVMGALRFLALPRPDFSARSTFSHLLPVHTAMVVLALFAITLWGPVGVGPFACMALIAPLYLARSVFAQYMDAAQARHDVVETFAAVGCASAPALVPYYRLVTAVSTYLAEKVDLAQDDVVALTNAVRLQDIAKSCLPYLMSETVAEEADDDTLYRLRLHPVMAASIIEEVEFLGRAATFVRHHHERWDGCGYPDQLVRDRIPPGARILAAANMYAGVVVKARDLEVRDCHDAAVAELESVEGTIIDPALVKILAGADAGAVFGGAAGVIQAWLHDVDVEDEAWLDHSSPAWSDAVAQCDERGWVG